MLGTKAKKPTRHCTLGFRFLCALRSKSVRLTAGQLRQLRYLVGRAVCLGADEHAVLLLQREVIHKQRNDLRLARARRPYEDSHLLRERDQHRLQLRSVGRFHLGLHRPHEFGLGRARLMRCADVTHQQVTYQRITRSGVVKKAFDPRLFAQLRHS